LPNNDIDGVVAIVVSRLVVTGGNHHRLHEEITYSGGYLKDKSYSRERSVTKINEWMDRSKPASAPNHLQDAFSSRFAKNINSIQQTLEARRKERLINLESTLQKRKDQEIRDITAVLDELEKSINIELKKENEPEQLEFNLRCTETERTQIRRDFDALKARLNRIPQEKEQEIQAIEHQYAGFVARTFPVAIIFLVPKNLVEAK
jgi:septal ring factor EnvC (AmiA/AmiB activator)